MFPDYPKRKGQPLRLVLMESPAVARLTDLIHSSMMDRDDLEFVLKMDKREIRKLVEKEIPGAIQKDGGSLSAEEIRTVTDRVCDDLSGNGPIEPLLRDDAVTDILINGPSRIFAERDGLLSLTAYRFRDEAHLRRILSRMVGQVGRRIDESAPYVDARLACGSRLNAVISPISVDGTAVSIRKPAGAGLDLHGLIRAQTMPPEIALYLGVAVRTGMNLVVSGGTGAGKTTLLNALSRFIGENERIITIEDTAELRLEQEDVIRLEARPENAEGKGRVTQRECLRNALRMRPDRILVGEVRGEEVVDMLQAMNTGHDGSMTTIHANTPIDALFRIENMMAMSGIQVAPETLRAQINGAIQIIVQIRRFEDGSRRITSVCETDGSGPSGISLREIFRFERSGRDENGKITGKFVATGTQSRLEDVFKSYGEALPAATYQLVHEV